MRHLHIRKVETLAVAVIYAQHLPGDDAEDFTTSVVRHVCYVLFLCNEIGNVP